jgi:nicotinamide mononucleotide transporter
LDLSSTSLSVLEWTGVLFNLGFVVGAIYRKQIAWPLGIIGSFLGAIYFIVLEKPLLAEASLYFFYVIMGFYGWWIWRKSAIASSEVTITRIPFSQHALIIGISFVISLLLGHYLSSQTKSDLPYFDAITTVFAVFATFLEINRRLYVWVYWIVLNALSIILYTLKESEVYAGLMVIYVVLSVKGLIAWKAQWKH